MNKLYEELTRIYETEGEESATKFYNEKIVPLLKKDIKKMRKSLKEF